MMTMAVVASGDVRGDVGFSQRHRFAMVSVPVMLESILVTTTAPLVTCHLEMAVLGSFNRVCGVTVRANRTAFVTFGEKLAVDTLVIGLLDSNVALAASLGDVQRIDRRVTVHGAFDIVHPMTIVARRSHN